ncbi:hypothetical protein Btru_075503 [Bulinus truncatus]|nr:hypothetical protein Btru_075503 [Bulinus truncatus]
MGIGRNTHVSTRPPAVMSSSGGRRPCIITIIIITTTTTTALLYASATSWSKPDWTSPGGACGGGGERHWQTSSSSSSSSSFAGSAPPLPELPRQYSVRVEANIMQKQWTTEVVEHYDAVKHRASTLTTFNGTDTTAIFNFQNGEKYVVFENGSCRTERIHYDVFGFSRFGEMSMQTMATVNEVFRIGTGFNQTYVGKDTVRGIPVDHWTSCQEWTAVGAWFQLDYYFSDPDYTTAAGRSQIPVRAVVNGSARNTDSHVGSPQGSHQFYHIYDFTSFRPGPFSDEGVFRIPRGVVCYDRVNTRPLPSLPLRFEMDVEVIASGSQSRQKQESIVYDSVHGVMQTSRVLPYRVGPKNRMGSSLSVTTVEDFVNRIVFVINEKNNSCSVRKLKTDFGQEDLSHRMSLFEAATGAKDYVYQGKTNVRDLLVDVWGWSNQAVNQEIYFLDSGKETDVGDLEHYGSSKAQKFATPIGMSLRKRKGTNPGDLSMILRDILSSYLDDPGDKDSSTETNKTKLPGDQTVLEFQMSQFIESLTEEKMIHFFHFNPTYTPVQRFDVARCFSAKEIKYVLISVNASLDDDDKDISVKEFTHALHTAMTKSAGLSFLQLQYDLHYTSGNGSTYFFFSLLGTTSGMDTTLLPLRKANEALQSAIQRGISFQIQLENKSETFLVSRHFDFEDWTSSHQNEFYNKQFTKQDRGSPRTYSSQAVAGIAIAMLVLGACLCFVIIYILYKRRHPGQAFMFYKMTQ